MIRSTILIAVLTSAAAAQDAPQPKQITGSLLPQNYTQEVFVDLDALQDTDLWDAVERSIVAPPLFQAFRKEFGYRFTDLTSIRIGAVRHETELGNGFNTVIVFQGSRDFELPSLGKDRGSWNVRKHDRIGGFPVVQEGRDQDPNAGIERVFGPQLFVVPRPRVLVFGEKRLLEPILRGKVRGGVPHPELTAFTAGYKPLAYAASKVSPWGRWDYTGPFRAEWLTKDDPMTFMMARLHIDPKTDHTIVSMTLRFQNGKTGPAKLKDNLAKTFESAAVDKRFATVADLIRKIALKVDRTDLLATLDLGGPKEVNKVLSASATLPLVMLFRASGDSAELQAVEAAEVVEVVEEKKDEKKSGTKKK